MPQTLSPSPSRAAPARAACSEAERVCARDAARELRAGGRRADVRTLWVHRGGPLVGALHAAAGLVASLVGVDHPVWGAAIAAGALLSLLLDAGGRVRPLRRLLPARATQAVVSPAPRSRSRPPEAIDLLLVVRTDVPRRGVADRGRPGRSRLGPERLLAVALLVLAGLCGGRIAGAGGVALDVAQLVATVGILLAGAALMDRLAAPRRHEDVLAADRAIDVTLHAVAELDREPATRLVPTVILCGSGADTLRPILRERRRAGEPARDVAVVEVAGGDGPGIVWSRSDGRVLPLRSHPTLLAAAAAAADDVPEAGARPVRSSGNGLARAARGMRRPSIAVRVPAGDEDAGTAFVLALVRELDAALARSG